jgi:hypothetical protein
VRRVQAFGGPKCTGAPRARISQACVAHMPRGSIRPILAGPMKVTFASIGRAPAVVGSTMWSREHGDRQ